MTIVKPIRFHTFPSCLGRIYDLRRVLPDLAKPKGSDTIDIDSVLPKATSKPLKFWQEFAIKNKIDIKNENKNKTKDELYSELLELLIQKN